MDISKKAESRSDNLREISVRDSQEVGLQVEEVIIDNHPNMNAEIMIEDDEDLIKNPITGSQLNMSPPESPGGKRNNLKVNIQTTLTVPKYCKNFAFYNVRLIVPPSQNPLVRQSKYARPF